MCMWQSQAFAGAFNFAGSVPDEFGTISCAAAWVPVAASAAVPVRNVRRRMFICRLPRRLPGRSWKPPLGPTLHERQDAECAPRGRLLPASAWVDAIPVEAILAGPTP